MRAASHNAPATSPWESSASHSVEEILHTQGFPHPQPGALSSSCTSVPLIPPAAAPGIRWDLSQGNFAPGGQADIQQALLWKCCPAAPHAQCCCGWGGQTCREGLPAEGFFLQQVHEFYFAWGAYNMRREQQRTNQLVTPVSPVVCMGQTGGGWEQGGSQEGSGRPHHHSMQ